MEILYNFYYNKKLQKLNKNHYGIQFHNNNYKLNDSMIFSIL